MSSIASVVRLKRSMNTVSGRRPGNKLDAANSQCLCRKLHTDKVPVAIALKKKYTWLYLALYTLEMHPMVFGSRLEVQNT